MSIEPVLIEYEARLQELQATWAQIRMQHAAAGTVLLIAVALILMLGFGAVRQRIPLWWPSLPLPIAAASARRYRRYGVARSRTWRLMRFYNRAIQRVNGIWSGQGYGGDEFGDPDHLYARDLGIFGEGSLFELLCVARTAIGLVVLVIGVWLAGAVSRIRPGCRRYNVDGGSRYRAGWVVRDASVDSGCDVALPSVRISSSGGAHLEKPG